MEIQHELIGNNGAFFIEKDGEWLAEMAYKMAGPDTLIIKHTEVDESLRGQGIGEKLLETLVDYVRQNNIKVIVHCPFSKKVFERREDLQDVLKESVIS